MILSVIILFFGIASHSIDAAVHSAVESLIQSRNSQAVHEIEYRSVPRELVKLDASSSMRIIDEPRSQYRGLFSLPVEITSRTGARSIYRLGVRVRTFETVAVALTMIDRHQLIDTTQLVMQQIETTQCSGEPLTSRVTALQGMRSTQIIAAGKMLTRSMIEPLPLVRSGSAVTVRVIRDNVRLTVTGKARADGWMGSVIAVDLDGGGTKRQVRARVVDRANVEIAERE
ncbi:MAG TPA: flagellar basal body P-ring formation chaperone FlgA [Bacteroidota bacterium]|nr:flagellar basal body P-ring formation chaperone FlgA [Bacteroidota bacterium]